MQLLETFNTKRLKANRLCVEDYTELCLMHSNSMVMATLGGIRTNNVTRQFLQTNLNHWNCYGFGLWMFRDKANGGFVGRGGLRNTQVDGKDEVELAYALMPEFWGQGLATEIGEVILTLGFEQLGLADVVCYTMTTNQASQKVMKKLGFKYERDFIKANLLHVLFRVTASTWKFHCMNNSFMENSFSKRMFEKWLAVILITLLPPLVPPYKGGKQEKSGSLPFTRGGLGWGQKYSEHPKNNTTL
ncbi:GNAT family N-acetyltransferase [Scytonema sp. UIC 10036]|uniref:GNAT family N-acetyltransferase n=1 Tax=Scytonema sp. UIC 10036 TaxID=2304196 RepID=UPI001A9A7B97|nr:GNAT family N-acetyltransferase [Scytonema sp. UIC 10036]